jgi:hypothetical protein
MISGKISFQNCLYPSDGTGITHSHGIATAYIRFKKQQRSANRSMVFGSTDGNAKEMKSDTTVMGVVLKWK